jgi:ketosteroid isomerase-like protein
MEGTYMKIFTLILAVTVLALPALAQEKKTAAKPVKGTSVEAAVKALEESWEAAIMKHDTKPIEEVVASDFAGVGHDGKLLNKAGLLQEQVKSNHDTYTSASLSHVIVRPYGSNVAVVIGDAREKGTDKDGKAFDRTYRFTDTWVERNGKWECVGEQVAQVSGK